MLKYLRTALTALSFTACVLLVALWIRSYTWIDLVQDTQGNNDLLIQSAQGRLLFVWNGKRSRNLTVKSSPAQEVAKRWERAMELIARAEGTAPPPCNRKLLFVRFNDGRQVEVAYWLIALLFGVCAALAGLPWIRRKYSLRTLLIATTLVAVGLGVVVMSR